MKGFEFEFDDEIFGESNFRTNKVQESYKPKQCEPEWFVKFRLNDDESERQNILKYRGDLLYQKRKYKEALGVYQESFQCFPPNNAVQGRELMESMALCLLKLGKFDDALSLVTEALNDSQHNDSSIWHLLSRVYRAMGNTQGEIDALQRCATLHSWNYQYWFSLALAYEKASASCSQSQERNFRGVNSSHNHCFDHHNFSDKNCKEKSLNDEYSQDTDLTIGCYSSDEKAQPAKFSKHASDEEKVRQGLEQLVVEEGVDIFAEHVKFSASSAESNAVHVTGVQQHPKTVCYSDGMCSNSKKNNLFLDLRDGKQPLTKQILCNCQTTSKADVKDKLQWRQHILSFGCLIKARFFLEKAVEASSSFVKDKCRAFLTKVNDKIANHSACGCVYLIDKVLEMLHTSVIASEQEVLDQEQCGTRIKGSKQLENSTSARVTTVDFEQKWFGDLLSYLSEES